MSVLWAQCQQHYLQQIQSKRTGDTWDRKMLKASWQYIWAQWDCRNFGKHHSITPALKEEIASLDAEITEQIHKGCVNLLLLDYMLLDDPLEELLDCHIDFKQQWLASITAAHSKYHQNKQYASLSASRQNINQWLHAAT